MTFPPLSCDARSLGWLTSLCLHTVLAFVALMAAHRLTLTPQPAPFTWHVAMAARSSVPPQSSSSPSPPVATRQHTFTPSSPSFRDRDARASIGSAATHEPMAPAATEPMLLGKEISPVVQQLTTMEGPQPLSVDERQTSPQPPVGLLSSSLHEQLEPPVETARAIQDVDLASSQETGPPAQTSSVAPAASSTPRSDYAWLSETIMRRMEELKRYPAEARLDRVEGKVVLKAIIKRDGNVETVEVFRSSGHQSLDRAAVELLHLAAPFHFPHSLDKPHMTVKIPMNYRLEP